MLRQLRENSDNVVLQGLLLLLALAFVVMYGSTAGQPQNPSVAQVNSEVIRDAELTRAWRNLVYSRQRGTPGGLSEEQRLALRTEALDQLIERRLVLQAAEEAGIVISPKELRRALMERPDFQDAEGNFDLKAYERWAKDDTRVKQLQDSEEERLKVQAVQDIVRMSVQVSEGELREAYEAENSKRDLEFVRVSDSLFFDEAELSDEEALAWAAEHEEAVQERYDRDFDRLYNKPEKRQARHILLKFDASDDESTRTALRERMDAIQKEASADGADFEALARKYSEDGSAPRGGDLGLNDRNRWVPEFSEAAFALEVGAVSEVVESQFGLHVIQVTEIQPAETTSLEDAKTDISKELAREEKAPSLAKAWAADLVPLLAADADADALQAKLDEKKLTVQETGEFSKQARTVPKLGKATDLVNAAFGMTEVGAVSPEPVEVTGGVAVFRVKAKTDPDPAGFEEKKASIRRRLLLTKQARAVAGWRKALKEEASISIAAGS